MKISRNSFLGSDKLKLLFFLLINVKMPTIVGILTDMSRKIFMLNCSTELSMKITLGPVQLSFATQLEGALQQIWHPRASCQTLD